MNIVRKMAAGLIFVGVALSAFDARAQSSVTTEGESTTQPAPALGQVPVQAEPLMTPPTTTTVRNKQVVANTHTENFMGTLAKSAFFGVLTGAIVGGAIYIAGRPDSKAINIAYWSAGGALVGVGVGVVQITVEENRQDRALSLAREPVGRTIALRLWQGSF